MEKVMQPAMDFTGRRVFFTGNRPHLDETRAWRSISLFNHYNAGKQCCLAYQIPLVGHLGKKQDSRSSEAAILLAYPVPGCGRALPLVCRVPKVWPRKRRTSCTNGPIPIVDELFYRVAIYIVGPLPRSRSGNRFILVVRDYPTLYPKDFVLKSIDAEHVLEALVTLFACVGAPKEIMTDHGTNFTSKLLAELIRLLHVKAVRTTPYHPQTDGLGERFNRTLKSMLLKTVYEEGNEWDKLLPYVLFVYREVPQSSTGFSPFELLYGRAVRGPLDILLES